MSSPQYKDLLDLLKAKCLLDDDGEPKRNEQFAKVVDKFVEEARAYLTGNQPVSHRVSGEAFVLQLQDGTLIPVVEAPLDQTDSAGGVIAGITQGGVRSNETTRSQSWDITSGNLGTN